MQSLVGVAASQKAALLAQLGATPVFALNAALLSAAEDVAAVLAAITEGSALSATLTPLKELEAGAVTKIRGVDDAKLAHKADKTALQALAKSLGL